MILESLDGLLCGVGMVVPRGDQLLRHVDGREVVLEVLEDLIVQSDVLSSETMFG